MQCARFRVFGLVLLALGLALGCGTDGTGTQKGDSGTPIDGDPGGDATQGSGGRADGGGEDGGKDAGGTTGDATTGGMDAGPDASGTTGEGGCTPMYFGCDDKYPGVPDALLCGEIDDGCGNTIQCDPTGVSCDGFEIQCNDPTKPNQCGCEIKTCATLAVGGAKCGANIPDSCGGTVPLCGSGDCRTLGTSYTCETDYSGCKCSPRSFTEVCTALRRSCNQYDNGCGSMIDCSAGSACSTNKKCVATGDASACACDPAKANSACTAAKATCGTITTADGCDYSCGTGPCVVPCASHATCASCTCPGVEACYQGTCCTPKTQVEACGSQDCGVAADGCGGTVACGTHTGGCGAGQGCADPTYNLDAPLRSAARVQKCIAVDQANLLGKYLVRTHVFRNADTAIGLILSRAEALSIVTVERSGGALRMLDVGCVATSIDENNGNPSLAPRYFKIPQVVVPLGTPSAAAWLRDYLPTPTGYINSRPSFCDANGTLNNAAAADFDTTTAAISHDNLLNDVVADTGPHKAWIGGNCTCKTGDQAVLPTESVSSNIAAVTDCRVNDIDGDGQPGFTLLAEATLAKLNTRVASLSSVRWSGVVDASGRHTGFATEPDVISRVFLGCSGTGALAGAGCNAIDDLTDWSCGSSYNRIQFRKLSGADLGLSCLSFYDTATPDSVDDANQLVINARFSATPGSSCNNNTDCGCTDGNSCSSGAICKKPTTPPGATGQCWPMTTPQACASGATCPTGWRCDTTDNACWPATCAKP